MARAVWVEGRGYALLDRDGECKDVGDRNGCVVSRSLSFSLGGSVLRKFDEIGVSN
jgi:hypothetical protein